MPEDPKFVKSPELFIKTELPKPEPQKSEPPKVKVEAYSSTPEESEEKTTKVSHKSQIQLDLAKGIAILEEAAKRAEKAGVTLAEAKEKYVLELAESAQLADDKKRKVDGDYYAARKEV